MLRCMNKEVSLQVHICVNRILHNNESEISKLLQALVHVHVFKDVGPKREFSQYFNMFIQLDAAAFQLK